jgi:integrase
MATFRAVVLKGNKRNDGTFNINIRLTHNRKSKYLKTNFVVGKEDLTKSFKLKNHFFISETEKLITLYRDICNQNAIGLQNLDISKVVELITQPDKIEPFSLDIVEYGRKQIEILLQNGKNGTAHHLNTSLNNLIKFVGRERIDVSEITATFLKNWLNWIQKTGAKCLYLSDIRKIHNEAKREFNVEEMGIINIPLSPFSVIKIPKFSREKDRDISVEKVRKLFKLEDREIYKGATNPYNLARDMFMLSFCLWGTNAIDLYECTDYKDGRITYNRTKTKSRREDGAKISIKVEPEILPLMEKYRDKTGQRVFCFYQMYGDKQALTDALGKGFRGIAKRGVEGIRKDIDVDYLTFYSARHSFATIAINDVGIDKYTVHQMLNHVDSDMKITDIYVRKSWKPMDEANRKLLDFVFEK